MDLEVKEEGEVMILHLTGELDLDTAQQMKEKTEKLWQRQNSLKGFILNLKGLTFMDSAGIGALLGRFKWVERMGGEFFVSNLSPQVERLLYLSGLLPLFQVVDTDEEALQRIHGHGNEYHGLG